MQTYSFPSKILAACILLLAALPALGDNPTDVVSVDLRQPVRTFVPSESMGAALDGYERGDIDKIYTPTNVKAMLSAGFEPISYRLRTELGIEAFHWNPRGTWSDPKTKSGYWTSSTTLGVPITKCNGYFLPRRGDTNDQANDNGYSRIVDGDEDTYWKSNPYLCKPFAPEDRPQWILVELGNRTPVDAIRIDWAEPYATAFTVQYWSPAPDAKPSPLYDPGHIDATLYQKGEWRTFPKGVVDGGRGGRQTVHLCDAPMAVPVIRIMLRSSSRTSMAESRDIRDRLGYAVRELYLGVLDGSGKLRDVLRHGRNNDKESVVYVSSTDPWHRSTDIDTDVEQPGFDRLFRDGITRGLPMMIPVAVVYGTPENAVAEVEYLRRRGYRVGKVEMGEEPDGQYMTPEDYAALYVECADALHRYDPKLVLGGPCFQTMAWQEAAWPDEAGDKSWTHRFIEYLTKYGHLKDLQFFSSEYYFYDDVCGPPTPKLLKMPELVDAAFARWREEGVPTSIPWYSTEFGYSPYAGEVEIDLPGAILDVDFIAHFLQAGGSGYYFYGMEPNTPIKEAMTSCNTYGNLALWQSDDDRKIIAPFAAFWAAKMLTLTWSEMGDRPVTMYATRSQTPLVTAYTVKRPDGKVAVMLMNKSSASTFDVDLDTKAGAPLLTGDVTVVQYSHHNYVWHANGENGYALPNRPPDHWVVKGGLKSIALPPYSITVVKASPP